MAEERERIEGIGLRRAPRTTEDAQDAKVELVWGEGMEALVRVTCPMCGRVTEVSARNAKPDEDVERECGEFTVMLGDSLRDLQRTFDSLRTADDLFE